MTTAMGNMLRHRSPVRSAGKLRDELEKRGAKAIAVSMAVTKGARAAIEQAGGKIKA